MPGEDSPSFSSEEVKNPFFKKRMPGFGVHVFVNFPKGNARPQEIREVRFSGA